MKRNPEDLIVSSGRRRFLKGAAGAALALPFLESLARPTRARAWTAAPGMPQRLVVFFNGHGLIMEEFVPRSGFTQGAILQPVATAGLASKMLVVTGVNSKVEGGHPGAPSLLTCAPVVANQHGITHATGASIDHVIARHMQDGGPPRRFDVAISGSTTSTSARTLSDEHTQVFWAGSNEHIPSIIQPRAALDRAFPGMTTPPPETPTPTVDAGAIRRRSVLDGTLAQFNRLQSRVSTADRERLTRHADQIRDLERALGTGGGTTRPPSSAPACSSPSLGATDGLSHARAAEFLIDTLALAIGCNQADVGTFKALDLEEGAWGHVSHPDLARTFAGENYHGAWHRASDQRLDYARRAFTAINQWHGSLFARLLQRLDQIDEGDGTALDHTLVLWISDFGHGGGHNADNLPIVIAGNAGGARLGRHVNYAQNPTSSYGNASQPGNHNLAVTLAQAFGIAGTRFGNYDRVAQRVDAGPLAL
ncbi:MAG: DUF1552 domain-containing protein [Myxococcales bacterium]|nr:DUF1552 domain-containing protein [Myxococcales bacterium]